MSLVISPVLLGTFDASQAPQSYASAASQSGTSAATGSGTTATAPVGTASAATPDTDSAQSIDSRRYTKFDRSATEAGTMTNFTFGDFVDMINPLQHIPVVSSVYREMTGETINPVSRVAGNILYGALGGVASAVLGAIGGTSDAVLEQTSGSDGSGGVFAALFGSDKTPGTETKLAETSAPSSAVGSGAGTAAGTAAGTTSEIIAGAATAAPSAVGSAVNVAGTTSSANVNVASAAAPASGIPTLQSRATMAASTPGLRQRFMAATQNTLAGSALKNGQPALQSQLASAQQTSLQGSVTLARPALSDKAAAAGNGNQTTQTAAQAEAQAQLQAALQQSMKMSGIAAAMSGRESSPAAQMAALGPSSAGIPIQLPGASKAFVLDPNKLGGSSAGALQGTDMAVALAKSAPGVQMNHTVYAGRLKTSIRPTAAAASPVSQGSVQDASQNPLSSSGEGNALAPSAAQTGTPLAANDPNLPKGLMDDIAALRAVNQYRSTASQSPTGAHVDIMN